MTGMLLLASPVARAAGWGKMRAKLQAGHAGAGTGADPEPHFSKSMHKAFGRQQGAVNKLADAGADDSWCESHRIKYKVIDGVTWGDLPRQAHKEWNDKECSHSNSHLNQGGKCPKMALKTNKCGPKHENHVCVDFGWCNEVNGWCGDSPNHKARSVLGHWNRDKIPARCFDREWCYSVCGVNDVEPDVHNAPSKTPRSWGSLSEWGKGKWVETDCNALIDTSEDDDGFGGGSAGLNGVGRLNAISDSSDSRQVAAAKKRDEQYIADIKTQLKNRPAAERIAEEEDSHGAKTLTVAVGCAVTTRGIKFIRNLHPGSSHIDIQNALVKLDLFKAFLPSFMRSIALEKPAAGDRSKYAFRVYIAVDKDDAFMSDPRVTALASTMIKAHWREGLKFSFTFVRFDNAWHKVSYNSIHSHIHLALTHTMHSHTSHAYTMHAYIIHTLIHHALAPSVLARPRIQLHDGSGV
jgi:hypothetical protein